MELDIIKCANCGNIDLLDAFHRIEPDDQGHPTIEILTCHSCKYESDTNDDTFELVSEKNICKLQLGLLRDKQKEIDDNFSKYPTIIGPIFPF